MTKPVEPNMSDERFSAAFHELCLEPQGKAPVVAIFGPTGVGKTDVALAVADLVDCRLISCDAVQVYQQLNAASAKPEGEQRRHPWALIDTIDVFDSQQSIDLAAWVGAAEREIGRAQLEGQCAIVVGGTGMYLRGLSKGVAEAPPRQPSIRRRLKRLRARHGDAFLHRVLQRLDSGMAQRLPKADRQRIVRALEVRLASGRSIASMQQNRWSGPDRFPLIRVGLEMERGLLNERLDRRVDQFFARGLIDEVRSLLDRGLAARSNALRAIGYREVARWLGESAGVETDGPAVAELIGEVKQNTRRYAKRQMTWFRRESPADWHELANATDVPKIARQIASQIRRNKTPGVPI